MRLSIGTAQFGFNYGITNLNGKVKINQISKIIKFCNQNKINSLDTAIGYGNSEKILGKFSLKNFLITTKLPEIPKSEKKNPDKWIRNQVINSCKRLKVKKIFCLLLHKPDQLRGDLGSKIMESVKKLKKNGYLKKFGVSVYSVKELSKIIFNFKIDLVNIPLSIVNRDFLTKNYLKLLKKRKIEIHVRSIFLQGILLNYKNLKVETLNNSNFFVKWDKWLKKNKISALQACLAFVKEIKEIDKIIIGIDNSEQLREIFITYKLIKKIYVPDFAVSRDLKDPSKWIL
jgi:aryl-alcohol dehydrogenase-like predicted oxidoreductase